MIISQSESRFRVRTDTTLYNGRRISLHHVNKKLANLRNNLGINTVTKKLTIISPKLILGRLEIKIRILKYLIR